MILKKSSPVRIRNRPDVFLVSIVFVVIVEMEYLTFKIISFDVSRPRARLTSNVNSQVMQRLTDH